MDVRKTLFVKEVVETDGHGEPCDPITRVVAMAVVKNREESVRGEIRRRPLTSFRYQRRAWRTVDGRCGRDVRRRTRQLRQGGDCWCRRRS